MNVLVWALLGLAQLAACAKPPHHPEGGTLFAAAGRDPTYRGKHGFPGVAQAKDHAFKVFQAEVRHGRIDPSREPDGAYRYLYLINNHGRLIQVKARRTLDPGRPGALLTLPVAPRRGLAWLDRGP